MRVLVLNRKRALEERKTHFLIEYPRIYRVRVGSRVGKSVCDHAILVSLQSHIQIWDPLSKFVLRMGGIT